MKYWIWILICLGGVLWSSCLAGDVDAVTEADTQDMSVITAERLTFDYQQGYALFEESVKVVDPELNLTSDRLRVVFGEDDEVKTIVASGHVEIRQEDRIARAGKATYDLQTGRIFLEDKPRVQRSRDMLAGDTITFWRDENKMICEPRARLIVFPRDDGTREQLFGD